MKKLIFLAALAGVALVGCNKTIDGPALPSTRSAQVTFHIASNGTKADANAIDAGDVLESAINTVDCFIFNSDGSLDAYASFAGGEDYTTYASTGADKKFYALVNAPASFSLAEVVNESGLLTKVYDLKDNKDGEGKLKNFQMFGYATQALVSGNNEINVSVDRTVARIRLKSIKRDFDMASLQAATMSIDNIYVINAVGQYAMAAAAAPSYKAQDTDEWYNKFTDMTPRTSPAAFSAETNLWLNKAISSSITLANLATENNSGAGWNFYVMPNDFVQNDDSDPENVLAADPRGGADWSARLTKLVVEVTINGTKYYYSIPIADMESYPDGEINAGILANHTYDIELLELHRPGSLDPDVPVGAATATFNISINDWTVVALETEAGKYVI